MWGEGIILVHPVLEVSDPESANLVGAGGLGLGLSLVVEVVLCWCLRGPHLRWGLNCRIGLGLWWHHHVGLLWVWVWVLWLLGVAVGMVDSRVFCGVGCC